MDLSRHIHAFVTRDAIEAWRTPGFVSTQVILVVTATAAAVLMGHHILPDQPGFMGRPTGFLLTGVMVLDLIWGTTAWTTSRAVDDQVGGMLDACRVTGAPLWRLIVLPQIFPTLLAIVRCLAYGLVGSLFIHAPLHVERILELSTVFAASTVALGFVGVSLRSLALTIGKRLPLGLVFAATASLCSGLFYPVSALPGWAMALAHGLPTTYMLDGMRRTMILGEDFGQISNVLLALGVLCALLALVAVATVTATTHRLLRTDPTGND